MNQDTLYVNNDIIPDVQAFRDSWKAFDAAKTTGEEQFYGLSTCERFKEISNELIDLLRLYQTQIEFDGQFLLSFIREVNQLDQSEQRGGNP